MGEIVIKETIFLRNSHTSPLYRLEYATKTKFSQCQNTHARFKQYIAFIKLNDLSRLNLFNQLFLFVCYRYHFYRKMKLYKLTMT